MNEDDVCVCVCVHESVTVALPPPLRREASLHTFAQTVRLTAGDPVVANIKCVVLLLVSRKESENEHRFRM